MNLDRFLLSSLGNLKLNRKIQNIKNKLILSTFSIRKDRKMNEIAPKLTSACSQKAEITYKNIYIFCCLEAGDSKISYKEVFKLVF